MSFATKRCSMTKTSNVPMANASVAQREIRHAALCMTALAVFEDIANTSQGLDQRITTFCIHLAAQTVNMDINNIRVRLKSHSPHLREKHRSSNNTPSVPAEIREKHEFLRA